MFKTRVCDIFGIEYPIILGGMVWVGHADLAAAVSEAGGLGLLGAAGMMSDEVVRELAGVREKTNKPFGLNIPLQRPDSEEIINAALDGGASVIATSSGSPKRFTRMIQDRGCKVLHVVPSVALALKCVDAGVDVIAAEGFEAGGHNGIDEITTMALVPQVVDAVDVPVVAAGGICDGRGFAAAFALGAEGVQMGTRFIATEESPAHPNFKQAILDAADNGTCITGRTVGAPVRALKNSLSARVLEAERRGMAEAELIELIGPGRSMQASVEGDCEEGTPQCGQGGGMIREIKSAGQVIEDVIAEAKAVIESMGALAASR